MGGCEPQCPLHEWWAPLSGEGMEAAAEGGWREQKGRKGGNHLQQQMPARVCLPLPPLCCLHLANPTLLHHFSLRKKLVVPHGVQAGGKPKGGAYLPARQLPGAGMLFAPASCLLYLHLRNSDSREPGTPLHGLCRQWGAGERLVGQCKLACAEQNSVYLCSSCLHFLPASAAAFWRHPAGLSNP